MDLANYAGAIDEQSRRKSEHAVQLRQARGCIVLVRGAGDQRGVVDVVAIAEAVHRFGSLWEVAELLEHQRDDLESRSPLLAVQLGEKRCLVVAVGAPTAGQRHDHDFTAEVGIRERDVRAADIGKAEVESLTARLELRGVLRLANRGVLVTPGTPGLDPGETRPKLSLQLAVCIERRAV